MCLQPVYNFIHKNHYSTTDLLDHFSVLFLKLLFLLTEKKYYFKNTHTFTSSSNHENFCTKPRDSGYMERLESGGFAAVVGLALGFLLDLLGR